MMSTSPAPLYVDVDELVKLKTVLERKGWPRR